jgi:hypothetical protein
MSINPNLRPVGIKDALGNVCPPSFNDVAFRGDYTGTDLIYKGIARPGTLTSLSAWQIALLTYDGSHNLLSITWPQDPNGNASSNFEFIWDDRASYTYS